MENKYIINDAIIFDVNGRTLTLFCDVNHMVEHKITSVALHTPTANCLEQLIIGHGQILSREQLLDSVWKKNGMMVSSGTVYQNISLMRRAFSQLGMRIPVIETVPRQGVMLSANVKVTRYQSVLSPPKDRVQRTKNNPAISLQHINKKRFFEFISASGIAITAILGATAFTLGHAGQTDYIHDYQLVGMTNAGCRIFMNENVPREKFREVLENGNLACEKQPYNYVIVYSGVNRYSIISCAHPIDNFQPDCRSQFNLGGR